MLCDIEKAVKFLENPNMAKWKSVEIRGDLKVLNPNSELLHFLNNLVTKNSNNIISANVKKKVQILILLFNYLCVPGYFGRPRLR